MNKTIKIVVASFAIAVVSMPAFAAKADTNSDIFSFSFAQEMAGVTGNGEIRADIYNTSGYPSHIRIGAFGGEVMIDPNGGATTATGIGYKYPFSPKLAIYGKLFLNSATGGQTNTTLGASYTMQSGDFLLNGNGHFTNANALNESTFYLNGAGFYKMKANKMGGNSYLGGEVSLKLSPSPTETNVFLGARWQPKKAVMIDLGFVSSTGGTTTISTPAFIRLNLGF